MHRKTITGWIAATTLVVVCGSLLAAPSFQSLYRTWGWMQRYGSVTEAREQLKTNPDDTKAHLTLAWTLLSSDTSGKEVSVQEARHEWEEVLRCDPSNEVATLIAVPLLYRGNHSTDGQRARARRLLTPIAAHGEPKLQAEAVKMLEDLDKSDQQARQSR